MVATREQVSALLQELHDAYWSLGGFSRQVVKDEMLNLSATESIQQESHEN